MLSHPLFDGLALDAVRAQTLESPLLVLLTLASEQSVVSTEEQATEAAGCLGWAAPGDRDVHGAIFSLF